MTQDKEQHAQKKYMELQLLNQKMQQIQQQVEELEQQVAQLDAISQNLDEFSAVKSGTEILVPIANGVFAKTVATDTQNLLVNVGASVNVQKSIPDVKRLMASQAVEMRSLQEDLNKQLQQLTGLAEKAEAELRDLVKD